MLKYNPDTKVIFDNDEAAVAPIREITRDEIPDLIADGAGVDASANVGEQTSSVATTAGDAPAAQDPAVSATGSATGADAGNVSAAADTSPSATVASDAGSGQLESTESGDVGNAQAPTAASNTSDGARPDVSSPAQSIDSDVNAAASGTQVTGVADSDVEAPEPVVTDAQADPGGAGAADLNPTPAAPNLDAQAASTDAPADAVPLDAGGAADAEAGSADAGESEAEPSAGPNGSGSDEHPLTIIGEIEALVRMIGNSAVHEYQRLIQRLADLKNHPTIKDGE